MTATPRRSPLAARRPIPHRAASADPAALALVLARIWLEVRSGLRPFAQLSPHLAPATLRRLQSQLSARTGGRAGRPARVRRVVASEPAEGVCEACVLVEEGARTTALAVRLERHRGRWRVVELAAPEAGFPAAATASLPEDAPIRDAFDEAAAEAVEAGRPGSAPPTGLTPRGTA